MAPATTLGGTATYGGASGSTSRLNKTVSAPSVLPGRAGVSMQSLLRFLYPSNLENPDSTGRLELFAQFGPTDEDGRLRGGSGGVHIHSDSELAQMASHACREALFELFAPRPRSSVEAIVETLHKVAMSQRYSEQDVHRILRDVEPDKFGRSNFSKMQDAILASQQKRLAALVARAQAGKPVLPPKERPPKVLFQSRSAAHLMQPSEKKKLNFAEEMSKESKRLNSYAHMVAPLELQNQALGVRSSVVLVRGPGDVHDRWDRYCALRRTGRSSYVGAKNFGAHADHPALDLRFNPAMDEGISNKYPGVSSLVSACAQGSSAAVQLAT